LGEEALPSTHTEANNSEEFRKTVYPQNEEERAKGLGFVENEEEKTKEPSFVEHQLLNSPSNSDNTDQTVPSQSFSQPLETTAPLSTSTEPASTTVPTSDPPIIITALPDPSDNTGTETKTETEKMNNQNSSGQGLSPGRGLEVNKFTFGSGTKKARLFFIEFVSEDDGKTELALIYWVKKNSKSPAKDKRPRRMIWVREITEITKGKLTDTFQQGAAQRADEKKCFSIHRKMLAIKKSNSSSPQSLSSNSGSNENQNGEEVQRTLDLEVPSEQLRDQIVSDLQKLMKKEKKQRERLLRQRKKKDKNKKLR